MRTSTDTPTVAGTARTVPASPRPESGTGDLPAQARDPIRVFLRPGTVLTPARPPAQGRFPAHRLRETPFHAVAEQPSAEVALRWRSDSDPASQTPRLMTLRLEFGTPHFDTSWYRWCYFRRPGAGNVGEEQPDAARLSALREQDHLSEDGTSLTLLVLPGEERTATLEFHVPLSVRFPPGDYLFTVVATDAENPTRGATETGKLRVAHQQSRLLDRLPEIWREETENELRREGKNPVYFAPESVSARVMSDGPYAMPPFFARWLRGFDDVFDGLEEAIVNLWMLSAVDYAPRDFLPWLASWVGVALDDTWPEMRRRWLIREAAELYRWRGTPYGLSRYLEIYTGVVPIIEDRPLPGIRFDDGTRFGEEKAVVGYLPDFVFKVTIPPTQYSVNEDTIRAIIETQKPAHTTYYLRLLERTGDPLADVPLTVAVAPEPGSGAPPAAPKTKAKRRPKDYEKEAADLADRPQRRAKRGT